MNYYKRHIGDYHKKAGRLTMLQHGSYTLLIDACYDRERFPTEDEAIDWCWASTDEEVAAVKFVLRRFFIEENGVYVQKRIAEEVDAYKDKCETNRAIAVAREQRKATNRDTDSTKRAGSVNDSPPNHKPLTNNHKPIEEKQVKEKSRSRFSPPTKQQLIEYQQEAGLNFDADKFIDYYEANGWMVGRAKMKDWKAAARNWNKRQTEYQNEKAQHSDKHNSYLAELGF